MADKKLLRLLERLLYKRTAGGYVVDFPQQIGKPGTLPTRVPTLHARVTQPITPMLATRFAYAGRWQNVFPGVEWLSAADMRKVLKEPAVASQIDSRREYWEGSVLSQLEPTSVSLFGIDREDQSEVYLAWRKPGREPEVHWYVAQHEHHFANLRKYVEYLVG
jgi:hypothetical protein